MKLTAPQRKLLERLLVGGSYHIQYRAQTRSLERLGFVETNSYGCTCITEAGRSALAEERGT